MRIISVTATPILAERSITSVGAAGPLSRSEFGIVRIETDDGVTGWGEISMSSGRVGRALCHDVNVEMAPLLIGGDPCEVPSRIAEVNAKLALPQDGAHAAKAAIEMALLDIVGKRYGLPLFQLLGGRARPAVPVAWTIPIGKPEAAAESALGAVADGYTALKMKVGRPGPGDAQSVRAVRAAVGPDISIKVDANMAYRSANQAYAALAPLLECGLQLVEQPLPSRDLAELARLREKLPVPLLLDESCWDLRDIGEIVRLGAADALNIYVTEMGGPGQAVKAFAAAESAGLQGLLGSQCELGLGTAAAAHVGVAVTNLGFQSDVVGPTRYPADIVHPTPKIEQGFLHAPEGPGLGVEVNVDAIAALSLFAK